MLPWSTVVGLLCSQKVLVQEAVYTKAMALVYTVRDIHCRECCQCR